MVTTDAFLTELEQLDNLAEQRRLIEREASYLPDEVVQQMKMRANQLMSTDMSRSLAMADHILYVSKISKKLIHQALWLMVQANIKMRCGEHREAISYYDEAQRAAQEAGSPVEAARSQVGKIGALMYLGEYKQAIELAHPTGEALAAFNEPVSASRAFFSAGCCYSELEQFQKALEEFKKAQALLENAGTDAARIELGLVLYNASVTLCKFGRYHEALNYSLQGCEIAHSFGLKVDEALFEQGTAVCYYLMGNYNKALRLLQQAHAVFVNNNLVSMLISCEYFTCDCYLELGRYEEAADQARRLVSLLEERDLAKSWNMMQAYHSLGRSLAALNQPEEAVRILLVAQEIAEHLGATGFKQRTDLRLAELYLAQQQADEIEKAERLLEDIVEKSEDLRLIPTAQLLLARIETERHNFRQARRLVHQAIRSFQAQGIQSGFYEAYFQLAEISEIQGDLPVALACLEQSIEQLERLRAQIAPESRHLFLRSREQVYEAAVDVAISLGDNRKAFNLVERVKSRALVELVDNQLDIRVRVHDEADRPIVEEIELLRVSHNDLTKRLARWEAGSLLVGDYERSPDETARQELLQQVLGCEKQMTTLTERLQVHNARYAEDLTLVPTFQPFDSTILRPDEGLIEYYIARDNLHAFIVRQGGVQVVSGLCDITRLYRLLSVFQLNLASVVNNLSDLVDPERLLPGSQKLLSCLYTTFFKPIEPWLEGLKQLRIVPHGSLHYLPFHALYNLETDQYLLEVYDEITYLPAAKLLRSCRERAMASQAIDSLVLGYSNGGTLPCSLGEARSIASILGKESDCIVRLEDAASLELFRAEAKNKKIIHLATHGAYRNDAPLFSSLLLAGGELTGHELYNLDLQASLITLSACDSGLTTISGGDEVLGLSRACLYAGASSLALSLWRVEDQSTSLLMQEFYRNLLKGQGKGAALRQAQLSLLQNQKYRHPFFWAPFILIGDSDPL